MATYTIHPNGMGTKVFDPLDFRYVEDYIYEIEEAGQIEVLRGSEELEINCLRYHYAAYACPYPRRHDNSD